MVPLRDEERCIGNSEGVSVLLDPVAHCRGSTSNNFDRWLAFSLRADEAYPCFRPKHPRGSDGMHRSFSSRFRSFLKLTSCSPCAQMSSTGCIYGDLQVEGHSLWWIEACTRSTAISGAFARNECSIGLGYLMLAGSVIQFCLGRVMLLNGEFDAEIGALLVTPIVLHVASDVDILDDTYNVLDAVPRSELH